MNIFCYLPSLLSVCKIVRISLESRTVGIWVLQWLCRQFPCSDTLTSSDPFLELSSEWEPATYLVNQCHHPHACYSVAEGATNCSQFFLFFLQRTWNSVVLVYLKTFSMFPLISVLADFLSHAMLTMPCLQQCLLSSFFFFPSCTFQNHL